MTLQTLQANVAIGEQLFVLKENGQYLPVTPTPGVPGGGAGPAPIAGVDDGGVAEAGTGGAAGTLVYVKGTAGVPGQVLTWNGSAWVAAGVAPFRATFYVDPAFTGTSTGSEANPFKTVAAAFAAGVALALIGGIVYVPPDATINENVVYPTTGEWELAAQTNYVPALVAIINGTIDFSTTATARRALTNIQVVGAATGNAVGGGSRLILTNCFFDSTLTLTATGGATWRVGMASSVNDSGVVGFGGAITGAVSVAGSIFSSGWTFINSIAFSVSSTFSGSNFNPPSAFTSNAAGAIVATFYDCTFSTTSFTAATGSLTVVVDGATAAALLAVGCTLAGATTIKTLNSLGSVRRTLANNGGAVAVGGRYPSGQMVVNVALTLLAVGTLAAIQASVTYTDMTGALVTKNVGGTLNGGAGGAIGDSLSASLSFSQNGATAVTVQYTGVTTPGALSYQADASVQVVS